jgi:hypothetical protein
MESMDIGQLLGAIALSLALWFAGAVIVVGLVQTLKKIVPALKAAPSWLQALIAAAVAAGVGLARYGATAVPPAEGRLWTCLGIIAVSQACYESIYRGLAKRADAFAAGSAILGSGQAQAAAGGPADGRAGATATAGPDGPMGGK